MRLSRKALARVVSGLLLLCAAQSAVGSLYDGKYGQYATFDVFRTQVNCITQGATCGVSNFTTPYIAPFGNGVRAVWAAGDYMRFVRGVGISGPVGDLNYPNVRLIQYSSRGVQKQVVSTDGYVQALGDGITDSSDNCPLVSNADQLDTDGDGLGDVCDDDRDNDGILDSSDNCPLMTNRDQLNTDGDGLGDVCYDDIDGDGITTSRDNCSLVSNPNQSDSLDNGVGDACGPVPVHTLPSPGLFGLIAMLMIYARRRLGQQKTRHFPA